MASHDLTRDDKRPRAHANGLIRLGWPHFWVLGGILAGMLGLVLLVFFVQLVQR